MQVVAKTPPIDVKVDGKGVDAFIGIIKRSIPDVQIIETDEPQDIDDWDYYAEMKARLTPAKALKIRRENAGLTQVQLAEKCGIQAAYIALMETEKRSIGAQTAKKLAAALDCSVSDFIR